MNKRSNVILNWRRIILPIKRKPVIQSRLPERSAVGELSGGPQIVARAGSRYAQNAKDEHSIALYVEAMKRLYPDGYTVDGGTAEKPPVSISSGDVPDHNDQQPAPDDVGKGGNALNSGTPADQLLDQLPRKEQKRIEKNGEERQQREEELAHDRAKKQVEQYAEAIRQDPHNAANYFHRGRAYQRLRNLDQALADFTDAIRLSPQSSQFYLARASLYMLMNKPVLAEADVKTAHAADPTLPRQINLDLGP